MSHRNFRLALCAVALVSSCSSKSATEWREHKSTADVFTIEFPGNAISSSDDQLSGASLIRVDKLALNRGALGVMQVTHYELLPQAMKLMPIESMLLVDCNQAYKGSKFHASEPVDRRIAGHPGLEISGTAAKSESLPNGGWQVNVCLVVGNRMVHLVSIGPDNAAVRVDSERFLRSFRLLN